VVFQINEVGTPKRDFGRETQILGSFLGQATKEKLLEEPESTPSRSRPPSWRCQLRGEAERGGFCGFLADSGFPWGDGATPN